jgi:hypothetical protein
MRPSSTSAAAPTGNFEYGAYACRDTSTALSRNAFQSMLLFTFAAFVVRAIPRPHTLLRGTRQ